MNTALLISMSVFVSILLLLSGVLTYYEGRRRRREIVGKIQGSEEKLLPDGGKEYTTSGRKGIISIFQQFVSFLGHKIKPTNESEVLGLRMKLMQAGYRGNKAPVIYFGYKVFLSGSLTMLFFLSKVFLIKAIQPGLFMFFAILVALIGFYLPNLWLRTKTSARQEKILEGFPDALDLMVVCVESGMGLDATISRVGEEMKLRNPIVSDEFGLMGLELRAGKLRRDAMRNLAARTGLDDVKSLMTLLTQTDKFGTSVAQALRVHSDSMRTRRYQRAEELAAKLPVKLIFPLVLFIFPALFVVIIGPAAIRVIRVLMPVLGGQ